ncbi:hypothetical protein ACHAWF_012045, partial [Thalassiosira exigua]
RVGRRAAALLEATAGTLGLLAAFDAHSPSYGDPEGGHARFLERTAEGLLLCVDAMDGTGDAPSGGGGGRASRALTTSLRRIQALDHRLLRDGLPRVISFACARLDRGREGGRCKEARSLLAEAATTYRELRQVGHFLRSARGACAVGRGEGRFVRDLLGCGDVAESLSVAYRICPSGQIGELWKFFDGWIADSSSRKSGEGEGPPRLKDEKTELSFAVRMFVLFIRNLRVDQQNATELRGLCERTARTGAAALLGEVRGDGPLGEGVVAQCGFDLCGWLVDLHARSCFWTDSADVGGANSSFLLTREGGDGGKDSGVLSYLRSIAESTVSSEAYRKWKASWTSIFWQTNADQCLLPELPDIGVPMALRGSLQRLALHRVQQLHSAIYYANLREHERRASDDLEDDRSAGERLANEARTLVDFSLCVACSHLGERSRRRDEADGGSPESLWSPLAQTLRIWAKYCDPIHAELLLTWFFSALCPGRDGARPTPSLRLEEAAALTLARDASFYDVQEVTPSLARVGVQFALRNFLDNVELTGESVAQESNGLMVSSMEAAEKGSPKLTINHDLGPASMALSFLASAPVEFLLCNGNLSLLDRVVGLDVLSSRVIKHELDANNPVDPQLLKIIFSSRSLVANILPKALLSGPDFNAPVLANLIPHLSEGFSGIAYDESVRVATCDAVVEYFSMCIDYHGKEASLVQNLFTQMKTCTGSAKTEFVPNALLIRSVIRQMNILDRHRSLSKRNIPTNSSPYDSCISFVQHVQKHLQNTTLQHISKAGCSQELSKVAATALLLASEILSFLGNVTVTMPTIMSKDQIEAARQNVRKVVELADPLKDPVYNLEFNNAWGYFLSSMAAVPEYLLSSVAPSSVFEKVLESSATSFRGGLDSMLLDAAFCSLIRNADCEQLSKVTVQLLGEKANDGTKYDSAFIVKVFHLLMTSGNSPEQHKFISGKCKTFLLVSMDLLRGRQFTRKQFVSNIKLFSSTMTTLISKKDLLLLSGREVAMILCEMNPLFHYCAGAGDDVDGDVSIFKSCCSVLESFIAHYPKQLYGCPSPLFSLLLALLSNTLRSNHGLSQKALEYSKVCELLIPHKDIFRKHVVGLILGYIQALNEGMTPATNNKLKPSIFAMLDMCSDFETRQINAMIDVPSKTLFAPVFKSYQKYYQYHGQA